MRPESPNFLQERLYTPTKPWPLEKLLQNSVDACKTRFDRDLSTSFIRTYKEGDELVVEDNGVGMDFEKAYEILGKERLQLLSIRRFREAPSQCIALTQ